MTPQKSHYVPCSTCPATAVDSCQGASAVLLNEGFASQGLEHHTDHH